jgi:hypothetical protein
LRVDAQDQATIANNLRLDAQRQTAIENGLTVDAQDQASIALSRQLASESELLRSENLDIEPAALLAAESMQRSTLADNDHAIRAVARLLSHQIWLVRNGGSVITVAFSADGRLVATGSADNTARIFDAANGKEVSRLAQGAEVNAVAFSPDGRFLATGSRELRFKKPAGYLRRPLKANAINQVVTAENFFVAGERTICDDGPTVRPRR